MKKLLLLLTTTLLPFLIIAQSNYTIKGKVVLSDGYLPTGNVIALNPSDSSYLKGASFFEGHFELPELSGTVLLKFSSLEFNDHYQTVEETDKPIIDLGDVQVSNAGAVLDEVVVKGKKPVYIQRPDGTLEVSIENTILSSSNSVNEILSKSPEIVMGPSGGLEVFGKGVAILYLNGKRITDEQLSMIPPANVKTIEIIRNPSAKYDAEGGAVINIVTISQSNDGYQAKVQQNVSYSIFGGVLSNSSVNFSFAKGRFSSNLNYRLDLGEEKEKLHTTRDRLPEDGFLTTDLTTEWNYKYDHFSNYGLGLQYDLDQGSYLSLEYSGFWEKFGGDSRSRNRIADESTINYYYSTIDVNDRDNNNTLSLNLNKQIDTLGSTIFIGGQYSNFDVDINNLIEENSTGDDGDTEGFLRNLQQLEIDVFSGQADLTKKFKQQNTLEIGAKYSRIANDFDLSFLVSDDNINFLLDSASSNSFIYDESIAAAYVNYKGKIKEKWSYALGLRGEFTDFKFNILQQEEDILIEDNYFSWFPNVSLSRVFSDDYTLNFSYTARINRPPYQRLNPVLQYQDPFTSAQGNPELKAQKRHAFEVNSRIKRTSFKVGYNYTIDPFGQTAVRGDNPKSYILKRINYGQSHQFFASLSRTFTVKWWTAQNTLSLQYTNLSEEGLAFKRVTPKPNPYLYSNHTFKFSDSFNAGLLFWYRGPNHEGLHRRNDIFNVTASLEKSFFDNSLKIRLIANDLFHNVIASGDYNVGQTEVYYNRRWSTDYFRLSLSYNFGRSKAFDIKNKNVGAQDTDRVQ